MENKNKNLTVIAIFSAITLFLTCLIAIDNIAFAETPTINIPKQQQKINHKQ
jgi:hypothetical protein